MDYVCWDDDRVGDWVACQSDWEWFPGMGRAIGLIRDGQLIAGFAFTEFRGSGCTMHGAGVLHTGWMKNRHYLQAIANFLYGQTECIRLTAPIPESDARLAKMLLRAGCQLEAVLPSAHYGKALWLFVLWLDKPNIFTRLDPYGRRQLHSTT